MMNMLMAVVRALKSRASTAAGEVISCQAELLTVQITRLEIGRAMNPARRASAATPKPEVNFSLANPRHRRRSCLNLPARSRSSPARAALRRSAPDQPTAGQARGSEPLRARLSGRWRQRLAPPLSRWSLPLPKVRGGVAGVDDGAIRITNSHPVGGCLHVRLPRCHVGQHPL